MSKGKNLRDEQLEFVSKLEPIIREREKLGEVSHVEVTPSGVTYQRGGLTYHMIHTRKQYPGLGKKGQVITFGFPYLFKELTLKSVQDYESTIEGTMNLFGEVKNRN